MTPELSHLEHDLTPRAWVWGLDLSSKRVGVGMVRPSDGRFSSTLTQWRGPRESYLNTHDLVTMRKQVRQFAGMLATHYPPVTVAYEAPTGVGSGHILMMHVGVILEAFTQALSMAPWPVTVSSWKQTVLGKGSADQAELIPWVNGLGPPYPTQDLDQLAGIGVAVHATTEWAPSFNRGSLWWHTDEGDPE